MSAASVGSVLKCVADGTVDCRGSKNVYAGGISGAYGNIEGCINRAAVSAVSEGGGLVYAAGISPYEAAVSYCVNDASVSAQGDFQVYAGGITAFFGSSARTVVSGCVNNGSISSELAGDAGIDKSQARSAAGGIAAYTANTAPVSDTFNPDACTSVISDCKNTGAVSEKTADPEIKGCAGGVVGIVNGLVENCINHTEDTIKGAVFGRIFGALNPSGKLRGAVYTCYSMDNGVQYSQIVNGSAADTSISKENMTESTYFAALDFESIWAIEQGDASPSPVMKSAHEHVYVITVIEPTCEEDKTTVYSCSICGEEYRETEENTKLGHDWDEGEVVMAPTCEYPGGIVYTCKNDPTHTRSEDIEALGHKWDEGVVTKAPTCMEEGEKTFTCSACQKTKTEKIDIDPNAHDYEVVTTPATCEEDGSIVKTCKHNSAHVETTVLEKLGHDWDDGVVTTEPTCEEKGVRTFTCKNDETHTKTEEIEALGHKWDDGAVTKAPTCSAVGEKTFTCSVCNATRTEEIAVDPEAHKWGEYVYNNDATTENDGTKTRKCELCGKEETVVAEGTKLEPEVTPIDSNEYFPDIKADRENRDKDRWYKPYVDYVATYKLMNGMADGTFAPNNVLTRAEFAQILANMSGVDTTGRDVTTQFTDVPAGKWYSAAIKWAAENGIVKGVTDTTFDPNAKIQRQHVCLMLVRYAEKFGIELTAVNEKVTFADDAEIGNSSKDAVYACQQAGIVTGKTETEFAPKDSATRAEIATFITRYHKVATAK